MTEAILLHHSSLKTKQVVSTAISNWGWAPSISIPPGVVDLTFKRTGEKYFESCAAGEISTHPALLGLQAAPQCFWENWWWQENPENTIWNVCPTPKHVDNLPTHSSFSIVLNKTQWRMILKMCKCKSAQCVKNYRKLQCKLWSKCWEQNWVHQWEM